VTTIVSEEDALNLLRPRCWEGGSLKALAEQNGVSASYVADVLARRSLLGKTVFGALGYERLPMYQQTTGRTIRCSERARSAVRRWPAACRKRGSSHEQMSD
jgi:hypothetical protein